MSAAATDSLGDRIASGLVIAPEGPAVAPWRLVIAEHPTPGAGSLRGGRLAIEVARRVEADDVLLVLLSGGASALMSAPARGLTLADKCRTTGLLLHGGTDIHSLNAVRKHLSAVKGGQLATATRGRTLTLAMSDVVGDDPSVIGSGPTTADMSTFTDALDVLRRGPGIARFPAAVVARLQSGAGGAVAETPKPGDAGLARSTLRVIASRQTAMEGAAAEARQRGYRVFVQEAPVVGEAREAAVPLLAAVRSAARACPAPCCVIASGETTVKVTGTGIGGRNQELALALVQALSGAPRPVACASLGTDGVDGPTEAAGAVVDPDSRARAEAAGLDPAAFLAANDSHHFFASLGDLIQTGPTGTNVGDLQVFLLA